jgi:hypothetical protein
MKRYQGTREGRVADVRVDGRLLNPRLDLWNHSPSGFEWGYGGSGPAQLALALLADHLQNDEEAVQLHQEFKFAVVAGLPYRGWMLTSVELARTVASLRAQSGVLQESKPRVAGLVREPNRSGIATTRHRRFES